MTKLLKQSKKNYSWKSCLFSKQFLIHSLAIFCIFFDQKQLFPSNQIGITNSHSPIHTNTHFMCMCRVLHVSKSNQSTPSTRFSTHTLTRRHTLTHPLRNHLHPHTTPYDTLRCSGNPCERQVAGSRGSWQEKTNMQINCHQNG